ncbi:hypothetical protein VTN31DRAFT_4085 [Thermomyces dupontii]|uniref:uncharacterized protein n=1 Tax=Talaromyces thermophilus TaxID=28565 RepID=UPI003742C79E
MHLPAIFFTLCSLLAGTWAQSAFTEIFLWPVSAAQPSPLARIAYDPQTLATDVVSYTPPAELTISSSDANNLVRVGFFKNTPTASKQWVGSVLAIPDGSALKNAKLHLHLSPLDEIYHVSLSLNQKAASDDSSDQPALAVDLVRARSGPTPELNKPIVPRPDGAPQEQAEKTFFQKYWWIFLIVTFLAMSGGGDPGQGGGR